MVVFVFGSAKGHDYEIIVNEASNISWDGHSGDAWEPWRDEPRDTARPTRRLAAAGFGGSVSSSLVTRRWQAAECEADSGSGLRVGASLNDSESVTPTVPVPVPVTVRLPPYGNGGRTRISNARPDGGGGCGCPIAAAATARGRAAGEFTAGRRRRVRDRMGPGADRQPL